MSYVKSFSTIFIDLLHDIVVTFATSHLFRSPLKAEAPYSPLNTDARKRRQIIFTSQHAPKDRRNTTLIKILKHTIEGKRYSNYTLNHSTNPNLPRWTSNIRIDLLADIVVTLLTSHLFRSPLKAEAPHAPRNTVARKKKADCNQKQIIQQKAWTLS
jgi:hypothetical protein